ncbi:RcnB family protein [Aquabacter sp. CN5-332]|uniref:RcnB family protein n=1 Tax=Aquabacter sp. CN5-332 TaxID=3156608 RepID=UPI0032B5B6A0
MRCRSVVIAALLLAASPLASLSSAQAQTPYGHPGQYNQPGPHNPPGQYNPPGPRGPNGYVQPRPPGAQANPYAWRKKGGHLPHGRGQVVNDYRRYKLKPPPRGYHWVRDGDNYMMVGITSGIISSILSGIH